MHRLRHTYASMLILLRRPITAVSAYLGHADVAVTMKIYAHFLKEKRQDSNGSLMRVSRTEMFSRLTNVRHK